jgi:hypothetical protein
MLTAEFIRQTHAVTKSQIDADLAARLTILYMAIP